MIYSHDIFCKRRFRFKAFKLDRHFIVVVFAADAAATRKSESKREKMEGERHRQLLCRLIVSMSQKHV